MKGITVCEKVSLISAFIFNVWTITGMGVYTYILHFAVKYK